MDFNTENNYSALQLSNNVNVVSIEKELGSLYRNINECFNNKYDFSFQFFILFITV